MRMSPRVARIGLAALLGVALSGCGYSTRGLYPDTIHTVAVPIFKNTTLRRDLEFVLTERVIMTIEKRTPFKVVKEADADTVLRGTLASAYKAPFGEDGYDNPRGGNMTIVLNVQWVDKRSGQILGQSDKTFTLNSAQDFTIDIAQSYGAANEAAIQKMSDMIVTMMQSPW